MTYSMPTTIQLDETTLEHLRELKARMHATSYDAVVRRLIATHQKRAQPLRGLTPHIGGFERERGPRD